MKKIISLFIIACVAFTGCDRFLLDDIAKVPIKRQDILLTKAQAEMIPSTTSFSFDFLRELSASEKSNVNLFMSPFSLQTALSMAAAGAVGQTQEEIYTTISYDNYSVNDVNNLYKTLIPRLKNVDNTTQIGIANSLWSKETAKILPSFKSMMNDYYDASTHTIDENFSTEVNRWVKKETKGMINSFQMPDKAEAAILNALYFKGLWTDQFEKRDNIVDTFYNYDGSKPKISFMTQKELSYPAYGGESFMSLSIPYGNGAYRITIMLPDEGKTVDDVIAELDADIWGKCYTAAKVSANIWIPKFETEYTISSIAMLDILKKMGINQAFTNYADFSQMAELSLKITDVLQKSIIKIDENGTEAATVTGVAFGPTSAGPPVGLLEFKVDHPFVYFISEISTGTILFAGVQKTF